MKKIFIVEDDTSTQKIYKDKLVIEGFEVTIASTGSEALTDISKQTPDLILLDVMLQGKLNGFDVLEELRKNEKTKKIPVIVLTNLGTEEKVAKEIGATEYFIKANTTLEEVVGKIKTLLKS